MINKIQITKPFLPPIEEYKKEIEKIWETNWLTNNGPIHEEFNSKLKDYLKVNNSTLFTNGHLALEIALKSFNFKKGAEVITTPFTFASTTHAIVNNNLKPVFCDINLDDYTIDVSKIEALITKKTVAILAVHIFGYPADVVEIEKIANKYDLKVIYDAAHAFGVEVDGIGIGNFGDFSMFSMHATKVFNSIEGGLLTYNNDNLIKKLNLYKNFGINGPDDVEIVGINAKMNEFQAAMGVVNLRYINSEIEKRNKIVNKYRELLKGVKGVKYLNDINGVKHNYSYFPVIIDEDKLGITRNNLHENLKKYNIFTRKYFYPLITDFSCYKNQFDYSNIINAKFIAERVLTLPLYSSLKNEEIEYICKKIKEFYAK